MKFDADIASITTYFVENESRQPQPILPRPVVVGGFQATAWTSSPSRFANNSPGTDAKRVDGNESFTLRRRFARVLVEGSSMESDETRLLWCVQKGRQSMFVLFYATLFILIFFLRRKLLAMDVASLRPSFQARGGGNRQSPGVSFSSQQSDKLWSLLTKLHKVGGYSHTFGALDPVQVIQMAPSLSSIYVSGWQSSSTASSTNEPGPDFADYPSNVRKKSTQCNAHTIVAKRRTSILTVLLFSLFRRCPTRSINLSRPSSFTTVARIWSVARPC